MKHTAITVWKRNYCWTSVSKFAGRPNPSIPTSSFRCFQPSNLDGNVATQMSSLPKSWSRWTVWRTDAHSCCGRGEMEISASVVPRTQGLYSHPELLHNEGRKHGFPECQFSAECREISHMTSRWKTGFDSRARFGTTRSQTLMMTQ